MDSQFNSQESLDFIKQFAAYPEELALRCYTARLIGRRQDLVLHGGGNSSVKLKLPNIVGEEMDTLFVKGSGKDLSTIRPQDFTGLHLAPLKKLLQLDELTDADMEEQLYIHRISSRSPDPSVEALLHAFLPFKHIDHTHADSILTLTHLEDGARITRDALGGEIIVTPYISSGFPLARTIFKTLAQEPDADAVIVQNHGIFTFGKTARESYEKMITYADRAQNYIQKKTRGKPLVTRRDDLMRPKNFMAALARWAQGIRGACTHYASEDKQQRFYLSSRYTSEWVEISLSKEAKRLCQTGVLTPDHAIRTKNAMVHIESLPEDNEDLRKLIYQAIENYQNRYQDYFKRHTGDPQKQADKFESCPRLFLVAGLGLFALGQTIKDAHMAADICEHTIAAKLRSFAIGNYVPIADAHVFEMEYWGLQRKKLGRASQPILAGQVAMVTGGGGAIGYGIAERLLAAGAAVAIADIDADRLRKVHDILSRKYAPDRLKTLIFDVTDYESVVEAVDQLSVQFGGIDILVPNAGIAHVATIENLDPDKFDQVVAVNLKGTFTVIKAVIPVFKRQASGGNIVVISSKNVFDPGAAFAAYSASKAGAHQISKIAAMELADLGVRVNMINPDAVFGDENVCSGLWDLVGPDRMKSRGLSSENLQEYYCQRSLLKVQVLAEHVGNAVVFFASNLTPTTGASLPVDAGNPSAFPR